MVARIILLVILLSIALFLIITLYNHNLYCAVFHYKDRKLWKKFIKEYQNFKFLWRDEQNIKVYVSNDNKYCIYIWSNGLCSVHGERHKCLLCNFDKKMSKIMADKLNSL